VHQLYRIPGPGPRHDRRRAELGDGPQGRDGAISYYL
jgi:hypothetical protein